jgi:hypothetical protein
MAGLNVSLLVNSLICVLFGLHVEIYAFPLWVSRWHGYTLNLNWASAYFVELTKVAHVMLYYMCLPATSRILTV